MPASKSLQPVPLLSLDFFTAQPVQVCTAPAPLKLKELTKSPESRGDMHRSHPRLATRSHGAQTIAAALAVGLLVPAAARAHFLWLTAGGDGEGKGDGRVIRAFLSETPAPDLPEFLKHIEQARITAGGRSLSWVRGEDTYRINLPEPRPEAVDGFCDMGVMSKKGVTFRLLYTARVQFAPLTRPESDAPDHLRLSLRLAAGPDQPPFVEVTFQGRPVAGAEVKAFSDEAQPVELKSDAEGRVHHPGVAQGRTALLAKWVDKSPGQANGKSYDEVRYYATLTVVPPSKKGS
jgi:hypothetical protein